MGLVSSECKDSVWTTMYEDCTITDTVVALVLLMSRSCTASPFQNLPFEVQIQAVRL